MEYINFDCIMLMGRTKYVIVSFFGNFQNLTNIVEGFVLFFMYNVNLIVPESVNAT